MVSVKQAIECAVFLHKAIPRFSRLDDANQKEKKVYKFSHANIVICIEDFVGKMCHVSKHVFTCESCFW